MANPQSPVHGLSHPRDVLAALSLTALIFLHVWELPRLAAQHGGLAFVAAWLLFLLLLGLPALLLGLALGRRSRRSPLEGLAFLTREADAPRFWRSAAWGLSLGMLLALAAVALLAGGHINFLARELELVDGTVQAVSSSGLVWPLGTGTLFLFAAGANLLPPVLRARLTPAVLFVVLVLLLLAALAGLGTATGLYGATPLALADWREALRLALLGAAGTGGVAWIGGMHLPRESSLARHGLIAVLLQILLAGLLLLALAPFVAAERANAMGSTLQIVPTGATVWMLMSALILATVLVLVLLGDVLLFWLAEKKLARLPSVLLVYGLAALLAEAVWFFGQAAGLQHLLVVLAVLLLLVLLVLSVFAGWSMKISHLRKELAFSSEAVYNLWRIAVRIVLPLAIVFALSAWLP